MLAQNKDQLLRFRKSISSLISQHVPEGKEVGDVLEGLAEKWNPLYDSVSRRNLVEGVNALVRDFVRPLRSSLSMKPPDSERIQALADQLSGSKSLVKITKKEPLKRYLALYILACLKEV